nr:NADH dehydrogenase subunit 3 [Micraspides sp.]
MLLLIIIFANFTLMVCTMLILLAFVVSKKTYTDREKSSPFECGFDPLGSARLPFSLRFFLIAVIFLIFDVEITLILPLAPIMIFSNIFVWTMTSFIFIAILLLGLFHEWNQGALDWSY